jgi:hypothetical protein
MNLLIGTDHADPYVWSAALLAHAMLGLILTGLLAALIDAIDTEDMIDGRGGLAALIVVLGYALIWEGAVQHLAEGLSGSLVDIAAIAGGSVIGLAAWARQGARLAVAALAVAGIWAWGILPRIRGRRT